MVGLRKDGSPTDALRILRACEPGDLIACPDYIFDPSKSHGFRYLAWSAIVLPSEEGIDLSRPEVPVLFGDRICTLTIRFGEVGLTQASEVEHSKPGGTGYRKIVTVRRCPLDGYLTLHRASKQKKQREKRHG
jgi:hypothetical protein